MVNLDWGNLLQEVRAQGIEISNAEHLKLIDKNYKELIPIILKHLTQITDETEKAFLVRCLTVKGFTEATEILLAEFYKASGTNSLKWTIGNALSIIQDKKSFDSIMNIVQEKEHGTARREIVIGLGKFKDRRAIPILLDLLQDGDVHGHAIRSLGYFKDPDLISYIEPFTSHKVTWIRNEAKKVIKRLDKFQSEK